MKCTKEINKENCTCSYKSCSRQGQCCECIKYHMSKGQMVGCYFNYINPEAEKTYDRSLANFLQALQDKYNK